MAYLFTAIVVFIVGFIIFKAIKKRKLPSNKYTPFDDITTGKSEKEDSKINTEDGWNRAFYGSPTIGGFIVIGIIIAFFVYNTFFN